MKRLKLKNLLFEQTEGDSQADKIYNKLLQFFGKHKEKGTRIETTYNVFKEYEGYIKSEIIRSLSDLGEAAPTETKNPTVIDFVYVEQNGRFYGAYVTEPGEERHTKYSFTSEIEDYIKEATGLDVEVPKFYEPEKLEQITKALNQKGMKADYGDYMDIS